MIQYLTLNGWYCVKTHGNAYQSGFPDIYAASKRFGTRWIEIKRPTQYKFTEAQLMVFTKFASKLLGVWVLTEGSVFEYNKLFGPANWHTFLMNSRGTKPKQEVDRISKRGPEAKIQDAILGQLTTECACRDMLCGKHPFNNWFALETYGSMFQSGLPDIFCCHKKYGTRWIECKNPKSYKFTPAQVDVFPSLSAQGVAIHILTSIDDLSKLFMPANWHTYLKGGFDVRP